MRLQSFARNCNKTSKRPHIENILLRAHEMRIQARCISSTRT